MIFNKLIKTIIQPIKKKTHILVQYVSYDVISQKTEKHHSFIP